MAQISSHYFVLLTWTVHRTKTLDGAWKTFAKNTNSRELLRCLSVSTQSILTGLISFELFSLRRERSSSEMNSIFTSNSLHGHYNAPCVLASSDSHSNNENKLQNGADSLIIVSLAALRSLYHVAYVFMYVSLLLYLTPLILTIT